MSITEHDWQAEQQRVDRVVRKISQRIAALRQHAGKMKTDIVDIRKNFWEDVTVNLDDPGEAAETYASMKQQAEVLSERERSHRHVQNQITTYMRLKRSPYFGRIDFREDGEEKAERIYLGIASFFDEQNDQFLVYDWRAPISSLYYDYSPGPVEYETPAGKVRGEMERKRQYMIRDGRIQSMFDTGITIGDELLQEVLGKRSDTQMKSIVATIQKEQNRIIRNERSPILIVQGAAGSGKTSAALQRVAYLLYRYRETLRSENIVLFSPNPLFNSYVSTVLPELGEENMQQTTFQEYLEQQLGQTFQLEDPFTQMEYILTAVNEPGYSARMEGIRYKAALEFMQVMERYITFLGREGMIFRDLKFRDEAIISAERIKERFYSLDPSLPVSNRIKLTADWLHEELRKREVEERTKPWVDEEIELLDNEAYLRVYRKLQREKRFTEETFDDFNREREMLGAMIVRERFKRLRMDVKRLHFVDIPALYRQLFAEPEQILRVAPGARLPEHWEAICAQTAERLKRFELAYEDATPYLYLKQKIEGLNTHPSVRHVFIDEAQDYSPFQFAFIKQLFPHGRMTLLGDLNQAIYIHATDGFDPLLPLYGTEQTETIVLTRSYRSTRQIVEFTRQLIAGGKEIVPFNRKGSKPTLAQASDETELAAKVADRIRKLQSDGHQTIAVICKTARESLEAYDALKEHADLSLIGKETTSFETGTLVIPSYLAKGIEFDAVIIYNGSRAQYGRESERKLFYTACTRAMHELHIYFIGEMSPFISGVSPDTYEWEA
ncbi:RNA polymerase recycling motor HelD [Lihuaxuella thermophila]|uniref:DNA helicase-2 / ATP-dependent DNA helicase PcrA n=1 Tax=Lihuaxuella thermophila TaxID=1173111 RepID=A0A1H8CZ34_9BACL|nr:RNA polymerase recycling motor HelD [Lihuaxuella thermophila]SEN00353.1 DNA helicase-2 / ATP-dependent DNA helicase PcrA [Lihuaxuella thermophila]